jgi:hypothetical protein
VLESLRQRGVEARVFQADVTDRAQVEEVIAGVRSMPLRGIMHANGLDDAPIERRTEVGM